MENESNKNSIQTLAQKYPLADILDIAEDVAKTIPAAGLPIMIVIKILRLLLKIKSNLLWQYFFGYFSLFRQ